MANRIESRIEHIPVQSRSVTRAVRRFPVKVADILCYVFLLVVVVLSLYPLYWMITSSFKSGADIATAPLSLDIHTLSLNNYAALLSSVPIWVGFKNTLI